VEVKVPAIIDKTAFNAGQVFLQSRAPKKIAPGLVTTPARLGGIVRCGQYGAAITLNTGKSELADRIPEPSRLEALLHDYR
jgi:hypothetical protein